MPVPCNCISVLYVDDEPALLDLGKKFLERSGMFDVETTPSPADALALLQQRDYDGVISDYQMPEMDGIELLKNIRSRYPDLPFIIFTGKGREEIVIQAFDAGADYYVQKGGDTRSQFRELSHKVQRAVEKRQVEKALKVSVDQYRNVVEDQTEFICRFLPDGTHNFVNDAYCRYFGMQREKIIGHRFIPQIPEEDAGIIRSHFTSLTRDSPTGTSEHRVILPDGSLRWHQWSDRAIFDESGTLVEYQSVGRDITDRKTAELDIAKKNEELCAAYEQLTATEEELRSSYDDLAISQHTLEDKENTLNAIIQESPIPQFVIDRNHKILYWNHALAMYSGMVADEVTGTDQQWRAFYHTKRPCLADLLVDGALDKIPELYRDKYAKSVLINDAYEATDFFPHMGNEGKWLHFTAGLIKNRNGNIIGAVESLEDITERKTAELDLEKKNEEIAAAYEQLTATEEELRSNYEELARNEHALRESEEQYRNVVEDQTEFICRFTPDGRLSFVNDAYCRYFGLDRAACIGMQHTVVIPPEDRRRMKEHLAALSPENPAGTVEHRIIMSSGDVRWQRWSDRAIFDRDGHLIEYQSVGNDVTERIEAQEKLKIVYEDLQAAYEQLAATEEELRSNYEELARNEHALRESEERYRNVVEDQTEFICRFTPDGRLSFVNDAYCRYFGLDRVASIGTQPTVVIPLEDRQRTKEHLAALSPENPAGTIEHRIIMSSGDVRWQRWSYRAIFDRDGHLIEYQSVGSDVTERIEAQEKLKIVYEDLQAAYGQLAATEEELRSNYEELARNEQALRESEERYRNVVEDQSEFICRFRPDGMHVFVNDAYCRYFKKSRREIIGHNFQPELFPEDRKHVREMFASLTPENPVGHIRQRVIFPDGSIRWQRWVDRAIYNKSGALVEYQSVGRDITDVKAVELDLAKKNEEIGAAYEQLTAIEEELRTNFEDLVKSQHALQESEERYRNVVEDQTEFICRFRPDGTHVFVNDAYCRYFKKSRREIIGHIFIPEIPEEDCKSIVHHFKSLTPENPVATIDHRIIMPDGSTCWQRWVDRAIYDESGALVEYQSVGRDITEYKRTEEALRLSEERYRNVVGKFSEKK